MKERFKNVNFDGSIKINLGERGWWVSDKRELCEAIVGICEEYQNNGDTLTLRQLYYQLVSKDAVPNHDKVYKKISSIKDELVYGGKVDWHVFEDRGRVPIDAYYEDSIEGALERTISLYKLNRQEGQTNIVEVWTEKDAISGILKKVTLPLGVKLVVNKGYTSSTAIYGAYERFVQEIKYGNRITILYFGDHDPSGIDMIRDIRERLTSMFVSGEQMEEDEYLRDWWDNSGNNIYDVADMEGYEDVAKLADTDSEKLYELFEQGQRLMYLNEKNAFTVTPIGLTMEQIRQYNPPPNPAKITDPRAKEYIRKYGKVSWEVDALRPDLMRDIVKRAIIDNIDVDTYNAVLEAEKEDKAKITKMINEIK